MTADGLVASLTVGIAGERGLLDEERQKLGFAVILFFLRNLGRKLAEIILLELEQKRVELFQVFDAGLGLLGRLFAKLADVTGLVENQMVELREQKLGLLVDEAIEQRRKLPELARGRGRRELRHRARAAEARPSKCATRLRPRRRGIDVDVVLIELVDGRLADAARGRIDDALDAHRIGRIEDHFQVGKDVLDFLAVVEPAGRPRSGTGSSRA